MSSTRLILEGPGKFDYAASDLRAEWKRWKRGFTSWMIGTEQDGKKEPVKLNLLLTLLGSDGQDIFETFEWPDTTRSLDAALERFDSDFAGLSNVTMTRFRFFSYAQGDVSVMDFVTGLKTLANDCDFGELRDSLVKDMVVIHCTDEKLRERLLKEPALDLAKAIEIARISEEAERNVDTISRDAEGTESLALAARHKCTSRKSAGVTTGHKWKFHGDCYECGKYGHIARNCPDREQRDNGRRTRESSRSSSDSDRKGRVHAGYAAGYALKATTEPDKHGGWYVDSGASQHMTPDRSRFDWYEPYRKPRHIELGDGKTVRAYGQGEVRIRIRSSGGIALVMLRQVQHVPQLRSNFLSVPATATMGNSVEFRRGACTVTCGSLRIRCAMNDNGLYEMPILNREPAAVRGGDVRDRTEDECSTSGGTRSRNYFTKEVDRCPTGDARLAVVGAKTASTESEDEF